MLRRILSCCVAAVLLMGVFVAAGCSSSGLKTVKGSVLLDGKPLAGADVEFVPKEDLALGSFGGRTGADGRFEIAVGGPGMSAHPGRYVVLVSKNKGIGMPAPPSPDARDEDLKELMRQTAPGAAPGLLPPHYGDRHLSPFTVDIHEGTTELEPFELRADGKNSTSPQRKQG